MKDDMIYRQQAMDALLAHATQRNNGDGTMTVFVLSNRTIYDILSKLPSAQTDRDIPMKPLETTDKAWGIPCRQAVCPKCDYYLGHVAFLGDYKCKRVTYCETCGQAIDWEGWDFDG